MITQLPHIRQAALHTPTLRFTSGAGHWLIVLNPSNPGLRYTLSPMDPSCWTEDIYDAVQTALGRIHDCFTLRQYGGEGDLLVAVTLVMKIPDPLLTAAHNSEIFFFRTGSILSEDLIQIEAFRHDIDQGLISLQPSTAQQVRYHGHPSCLEDPESD